MEQRQDVKTHSPWLRILLVTLILLFGAGAMAVLSNMREDPPPSHPEEPIVQARGIRAELQDIQTILSGYGTARPHRRTTISPEVSGRVLAINPNLEEGNVVQEGDVLFEIDERDYSLARQEAQADLARLEAQLDQLGTEKQNDKERLKLAQAMLEVARRDYDRVERLYETGGVESEARVDAERMKLRQQELAVQEIENKIGLYGTLAKSLEAQIDSANARIDKALLNLERARVTAPFTGRVEQKSVEKGQRIQAGSQTVVLADDRILEIPVSLDSESVSRWLNLIPHRHSQHWFRPAGEIVAQVQWTEGKGRDVYTGRLDRIESYDSKTRTFRVVVRLEGQSSNKGFPLAAGMFCEVRIPGKQAKNVIPIPREAVDSNGSVLLSHEGRLKTRTVQVVRYQGRIALVSSGIEPGDVVLTSRPPQVIDGMRVDVMLEPTELLAAVKP